MRKNFYKLLGVCAIAVITAVFVAAEASKTNSYIDGYTSTMLMARQGKVLASAVTGGPAMSGVLADAITKSSARINWTTATPSTALSTIFYGRTAAYGYKTQVQGDTGATKHNWFIAGLAASTLYHYCIQSTDASGASVCDGAANDFTFTTAAESSSGPEEPKLPQKYIDTSMPAQAGKTWNVNPSDCNDSADGLQATLNKASLGDTVVIPAGMVCSGAYTFPAKTSGSGWIVVRTSTPDDQLPPPGTRIQPAQAPLLATLQSTFFDTQTTNPRTAVAGDACNEDDYNYGWHLGEAGFPLLRCQGGVWKSVTPAASGTAVPAACSTGDWFYKTDAAEQIKRGWLCVSQNHYVQMIMGAKWYANAAAMFPANAHHYRLVGLEITVLPTPASEKYLDYASLVSLDPAAHDITIDRTYLHGLNYPSRLHYGIYFQGASLALVDSYMDGINNWVRADDPLESDSFGLITDQSPGPLKVVNNFISVIGISLQVSNNGTGADTSDAEIRGNYFYKDPKYWPGSPQSDGHNYHNRHHLELKRGQRWLIDGNVFENNWGYKEQGKPLLFTISDNYKLTADITMTNNIIKNAPVGAGIVGHGVSSTTAGQNQSTARIKISNNLFTGINGDDMASGFPNITYPNGRFTEFLWLGLGIEDLIVNHNTVEMIKAKNYPTYLFGYFNDDTPSANLQMNNNILSAGDYTFSNNYKYGTEALNTTWMRNPGPAWQVQGNVMYGKPSASSTNPGGNFWPADFASVGFVNAAAGNYALAASSPFKNKGTDGSDPGVNMSQLQAATANAVSGGTFTPPPVTRTRTIRLSGLEGLSSVPPGTPITVAVLSAAGALLETKTNVMPDGQGNYTVNFASSDPQTVNLKITVSGYLPVSVASVSTSQSVAPISLPQMPAGDFNSDGVINSLDFSLMNSHWNQNYAATDINKDNLINSQDFSVLKNNFGKTGP